MKAKRLAERLDRFKICPLRLTQNQPQTTKS